MKNIWPLIYRWHQKVGIYIALAIVCWALTGVAHPIISRVNPQPAVFSAPAEVLSLPESISLAQLLTQHNIETISQLKLFSWNNIPTLRLESNGDIEYINLLNHEKIINAEHQYAEYLARHFSGDQNNTVTRIESIDTFNDDYVYINRLLPAQKVNFNRDDNLRVYVDTQQGRLASLSNDTKYITSYLFRNIHSLVFIESNGIRTAVMLVILSLGFLISLAGLCLYIALWRRGSLKRKHTQGRRWHRSLGAFVALAAMGFCFSGGLHAWNKYSNHSAAMAAGLDPEKNKQLRNSYHSKKLLLNTEKIQQALASSDIISIQLVTLNNQYAWRITPKAKKSGHHGQHHHQSAPQKKTASNIIYLANNDFSVIKDADQLHAQQLAVELSGLPLDKASSAEIVRSFGGEYGFVNKRLPVYRIDFDLPGKPSIYVENNSSSLAARVVNRDRVEGFSFAYIHKWHHFDFLGKNGRDALLAFFAFAIAAALLLGVWRYALQQGWLKKTKP